MDIFLPVFGIIEGILVLWFLSGKGVKYPAILTMFLMIGIIAFNMNAFDVLFRNVSIAFSALALAILDHNLGS